MKWMSLSAALLVAGCASSSIEPRANGPAVVSGREAPRMPGVHAFDPEFAPSTLSVGPPGAAGAHHHHQSDAPMPSVSASPEGEPAP